MITKNYVLGVGFTNETKENISEYILKLLQGAKKFIIVTPNPEIVVYAARHEDYKKLLNRAEISLPDGVGVTLAAQILGKPFKERITGVDFIESLCVASKDRPISMGFLGAKPKIAERAVECLREKYPWINVALVGSEWSEASLNGQPRENVKKEQEPTMEPPPKQKTLPSAIQRTAFGSRKTIDLLFVAFGAPKQELWIFEHLQDLPVKAAMGVGGAFDYLSGEVKRAPVWMRRVGLEWLFRLINQPWRWKRQLALLEFGWMVAKEKIGRL